MQRVRTFVKSNLLPFLYSGTIMGSMAFGYIAYRVNKNRASFEKMKENEGFKDSTRLDYDFYGLNWGVASDNMVILSTFIIFINLKGFDVRLRRSSIVGTFYS